MAAVEPPPSGDSALTDAPRTPEKGAAARSEPHSVYESRAKERARAVRALREAEHKAGMARLFTFLAAAAAAGLAFGPAGWSGWWILPGTFGFVAAVGWHQRIVARRRDAERAVVYYRRAVARVDDQWRGVGATGADWAKPTHPFAGDLDLFGEGSLFQLLCAARTRMGQHSLAKFLLDGADPKEVLARQEAVRELAGNLDLFEELALLGTRAKTDLDPDHLARWTRDPSRFPGGTYYAACLFTGLCAIAAAAAWGLSPLGGGPFLLILVVEAALTFRIARLISELLKELDSVQPEVELLAKVLSILERQKFESPRLKKLQELLAVPPAGDAPSASAAAPSAELNLLRDRWSLLEQCVRNQFLAPLAFTSMGLAWVVHSVEQRRSALSGRLANWLRAVGEFEALASLARNAYENPDHVWPEFAAEAGPHLELDQAGHPLLARARCVRNDLRLAPDLRLLLVSGSNMSGKSTMLRTVGLNVVLALAGGVVRAKRMRLSSLQVGSAMRVQDNLMEGASHFYAEIRRLRSIVDLAQKRTTPVLFLLDEILHGTNSHDRRVGAEAVIRSLLAQGAVGMVTTHDLSLAEIVDEMAPAALNVHFEDQWRDGHMTFDYQMRPGVVPRSNAIALMRLLGLDVPDAAER